MRRGPLPPRRGDANEDAGRELEHQEGGCGCVPKSLEQPKHQDLSKKKKLWQAGKSCTPDPANCN